MRQPSLFLAVALSTLLCGAQSPAPGTINYIEGLVAAGGGQNLEPGMQVKPGQSLTTSAGKAELLLTPGAFLRVGENARVTINSASLAATEVQVDQGRAILEVAQIQPQRRLRVNVNGAVVRIGAAGLYDFDAGLNQVHVFEGTAAVAAYGMRITLTGGHWLDLNSEDLLVAALFDATPNQQDDLYQWSSLRSAYLAEANISAAESAPAVQGSDGWSWDPSYDAYTFVPDNGVSYSPFGWGFYSPFLVYQAPITIAPGPGHRFHLDPGQWGPGRHYAITEPQRPAPRPSPRVPVLAPSADKHAVTVTPPADKQAVTVPARRFPTPTNSSRSETPRTPTPAPSEPVVVNGPARPAPRMAPPAPVQSFKRAPEPVQSFRPAPPAAAPAFHPAPAPVVQAPAPAMHIAPQPAPAAPKAAAEPKRN